MTVLVPMTLLFLSLVLLLGVDVVGDIVHCNVTVGLISYYISLLYVIGDVLLLLVL